MENTVVIFNAGIGAMTMGFQNAGFNVIAAYENDKRAIELYRENIKGEISCYENTEHMNPNMLPDADILAGSFLGISSVTSLKSVKRDVDYFAWVRAVLYNKRPKIVCLVFPGHFLKKPFFADFQEYLAMSGYSYSYAGISTEKATGFPIAETHFYLVAVLPSVSKTVEFPGGNTVVTYPMESFCDRGRVDDWYYRLNDNQIQVTSQKDTFLCWKKERYVERELADTNLIKVPLVRIDGNIRKITHKELAFLKGFPKEFRVDANDKAWLYKKLVYSPNVKVVTQLAKAIGNVLRETPLRKSRVKMGYLFEQVFGKYLEKKKIDFQEGNAHFDEGFDFEIQNQTEKIKFELKIYNNNYALAANLLRACEKFCATPREEHEILVLVVGNVVKQSIKEKLQKQYGIYIWDVKNLLWLFEEYPDIKNEFIALLAYSVDEIQQEAPVPNLFDDKTEESEESNWKNKLLSIDTGRENFKQYEEVCTEILKYVLGDYLRLWAVQEKSNDGLYRFDLCCKIKNGVNQDFFDTIQNYFRTKYIVFEFKNYAEKISQKEIYTTEKYLYEKALRSVAIIVSRQGADENALSATRGCLRENGKLILCLSDQDLLELIDMKDKDEQPTAEYFEAMLDDLLIHLEK